MKTRARIRMTALLALLSMTFIICTGCVTLGRRNPTATVSFSDGTQITIRLYYDKAPNTVKNFISLAESGFYDGLTVHRIVRRTLVQMGDPNGDGTGNAGYYIKGEFSNNGYGKNDLSNTSGMVAMARSGSQNNDSDYYDTASSQFYILLSNKTDLDGDYAVFGEVISGLTDLEDNMGTVETDDNNRPLEDIYIESVTIETYGESYGNPSTITIKD